MKRWPLLLVAYIVFQAVCGPLVWVYLTLPALARLHAVLSHPR